MCICRDARELGGLRCVEVTVRLPMSRWEKFGNWATLRAPVLPVTWAPVGWNVVTAGQYNLTANVMSTLADIF